MASSKKCCRCGKFATVFYRGKWYCNECAYEAMMKEK